MIEFLKLLGKLVGKLFSAVFTIALTIIILPFYCIYLLICKIFHIKPKKSPQEKGYGYEKRVANSLERKGYTNVEVTPKSGDFGADILATDPYGNRICIQCKYYAHPVGVKAVQEVVSAKGKHGCTKSAVYTNSKFTRQAKELAFANEVDLIECYEALFE